MTKTDFFKLFTNCDNYMLSNLWNTIELVEMIETPIFTKEFYPPIIWNTLENLNINGNSFIASGLNETSEKKILMVYPRDYDISEIKFPSVYFKIDGKNKFKELFHKDFLGTIMSLGLKREVLGDLIVENSICYGVTTDEIYDIIKENLDKVGNIPVEFIKITKEEVPEGKFEEKTFLLPSLRIDSLVSSVTGLSRQKSVDEITKGNVLLNYNAAKDKSVEIKEGDIFTIKKVGKFKFEAINGSSKKNKIRINVKKFI